MALSYYENMENKKDMRGRYMLKMSAEERSAIMAKRARERWAKTTKTERTAYAYKLVNARIIKKLNG